MKDRNIPLHYKVYENVNELDTEIAALIADARKFSKNAYAPYSKFRVSAVLKLESGEILRGTNVENASFPVSVCAERNLLSATISNYPGRIIQTLVIYVDKKLPEPASPCGMCRQALVEAEQNQRAPITLYLAADGGPVFRFSDCSGLLPLAFSGAHL